MAIEQEWIQNIKRRREQQIRYMKKNGTPYNTLGKDGAFTGESTLSGYVPWHKAASLNADKPKRKRKNKFLYQWILAMVLFLATTAVFTLPENVAAPLKNGIYQVLTKEFRFAEMQALYQKYAGGSPAFLPAFSKKSNNEKNWAVPVSGKITLPFDEKRKGIVLATPESAQVVASQEGWVEFTGNKNGLGNTIIIQHANGRETWYGWLEEINVREKDWVKKGQPIGKVKKMHNQSFLYFALRDRNQFVNPASVITFE
ncbi:M23 family metallopeptidase [Thermoactinomyces mirandus]|uniref:M23 family metallopeptidase n=1 Tax=Thermoactinomyces mirandus TaxID=2756294 RepID=A0A7W2ARS5_9BACL|nr:M23 family metallopeptidase [Thermoactinomyces mirandus]MBA4602722.1 M23 family metallopeptidase [Thermoactinomyces mirandus]